MRGPIGLRDVPHLGQIISIGVFGASWSIFQMLRRCWRHLLSADQKRDKQEKLFRGLVFFIRAIGGHALCCTSFRGRLRCRGDHDEDELSAQLHAIRYRGRHRRVRLAHAIADHRLRLPDLADVVRAPLLAWLFSDADVGGQSLGPRRIRLGVGAAESAVGHRPAARRHHRRPLRHRPGARAWAS